MRAKLITRLRGEISKIITTNPRYPALTLNADISITVKAMNLKFQDVS